MKFKHVFFDLFYFSFFIKQLVWAPCIMHRCVIYPIEPPPTRSFAFPTPDLYPVDPWVPPLLPALLSLFLSSVCGSSALMRARESGPGSHHRFLFCSLSSSLQTHQKSLSVCYVCATTTIATKTNPPK
jgi:hypothetical protein